MKRHLGIILLITIFCLLISQTVSAAENYTVTVGKDKTFTVCNDKGTYRGPDIDKSWCTMPNVGVNVDGNTVTSHSSASYNQAGWISGYTGVKFNYYCGNSTWEDVKSYPIEVIVDFDYTISADYDTNAGYANSFVRFNSFNRELVNHEYPIKGDTVYDCIGQFWNYQTNTPVGGPGIINKRAIVTFKELKTATGNHPITIGDCFNINVLCCSAAGNFKENTPLHNALAKATINSIKIHFLPIPKLSLDYKKTVNSIPTYNKENIYGTDKISFILNATNEGVETLNNVPVKFELPSDFKYISSSGSGTYDPLDGVWTIDTLDKGEKKTITINVFAINSSTSVKLNASVFGVTKAYRNINLHNPVIFVHGFTGSPTNWDTFTTIFRQRGMTNYCFDYRPGIQDPYVVASSKFRPWITNLINNYSYKGKFDIICHSMGALVTRFYMQRFHEAKIDQWIGLAPVNHGAAVADVIMNPSLNPTIYKSIEGILTAVQITKPWAVPSSAVYNMRTVDYQTKLLNAGGPAPNVTYRVIVGVSPLKLWWIKLADSVIKLNNKYYFTTNGDGIVANIDSILSWQKSYDRFAGWNHLSILNSYSVIYKVISYLQT